MILKHGFGQKSLKETAPLIQIWNCCCRVGALTWYTQIAAPYIFTENVLYAYSSITLPRNVLALQNLAQMCSFKLSKSQ